VYETWKKIILFLSKEYVDRSIFYDFSYTIYPRLQRNTMVCETLPPKDLASLPCSNGFDPEGSNGFDPEGSNGFDPEGSNGFDPEGSNGFDPEGSNGFDPEGSNGFDPEGRQESWLCV
jgi:hypothetical protein